MRRKTSERWKCFWTNRIGKDRMQPRPFHLTPDSRNLSFENEFWMNEWNSINNNLGVLFSLISSAEYESPNLFEMTFSLPNIWWSRKSWLATPKRPSNASIFTHHFWNPKTKPPFVRQLRRSGPIKVNFKGRPTKSRAESGSTWRAINKHRRS